MSSALLIVAGLAGLLFGADLLVRGGAALASQLGVRAIVIGLTVVSLGTSLPELAVGIDAVRQGSPGLAVGNIVGTNLVNVLFILGLSALIRPVAFERRTLRFDLPAMTAATVFLLVLGADGALSNADGMWLCAYGAVYLGALILASVRTSRRERATSQSEREPDERRTLTRVVRLAIGLVVIVAGSELLVDGA